MADNHPIPNQPDTAEIIPTSDLRPTDVLIHVEFGEAFEPSERLKNALEELAASVSEMEDAEVAGFSMDHLQMGVISDPFGNDLGMSVSSVCKGGGWLKCIGNACAGGNWTKTRKAFDEI